jgi:deoxyribodipyrimidine photolyase-related protein
MDTVWILGDQLSHHWPAWLAESGRDPGNTRILLVESAAKLRSRPWHRHKLILVLSALRHYAGALREAGWQVDHRRAPDFAAGLRDHVAAHRPGRLLVMEPATWQGREFVRRQGAARYAAFEVLGNRFFLAGPDDLGRTQRPLLEAFYRRQRRRLGYLMAGDGPAGGRWNFDADNRLPPRREWRRAAPGAQAGIPSPPAFPPDEVTREVIAEVARVPTAWGELDGFSLPVTRAGALVSLADFVAHRLRDFGAYEDAMVAGQPSLFHSVLSPLLNLGLLDPAELCTAAGEAWAGGRAPLNSVEGFVRQVIGWREFVQAVYRREMPAYRQSNALGATRPLPTFYWTGATDLACLRDAIASVQSRGYTHHIQRLMLLANFALLAGVRPDELNEWFLAAFVDAYDWVVTPNVLGLGTFADGGIVGTKPYAAGGSYLHRMGTHCEGCRYDVRQRVGPDACPFNALYWDFVARHAERLAGNPRTAMPVRALRRMAPGDVAALRRQAAAFLGALQGPAG